MLHAALQEGSDEEEEEVVEEEEEEEVVVEEEENQQQATNGTDTIGNKCRSKVQFLFAAPKGKKWDCRSHA